MTTLFYSEQAIATLEDRYNTACEEASIAQRRFEAKVSLLAAVQAGSCRDRSDQDVLLAECRTLHALLETALTKELEAHTAWTNAKASQAEAKAQAALQSGTRNFNHT